METITEIRKWLIYFWTMSENRSKTGERKKRVFRASLRELKIWRNRKMDKLEKIDVWE